MRAPGFRSRLVLSTALILMCAAAVSAQPAHLVKDIDDTTRDGGVYIQEMSALGPSVYFGASAFSSFEQLWKSDGTTQGTWKLRDFDVVGGSQPHRFTRTASKLFFFVGRALWRLNAAGDASLVKELPTEPTGIAVLGDELIMAMGERDVWRSDGTPAGTFRVANLPEQSYPSGLTSARGFVYFFARDYAAATLQMWRTDGTEAGTRPQVELGPVGVWLSAALGDTLVFIAYSGVGDRPYALLRSDGTAQGTTPIASFAADTGSVCPLSCPPYGPSDFTVAGSGLFFIANEGEHGRELWRTDGTSAGTVLVRDVNPGPDAGLDYGLLATDGHVFFAGHDPEHGTEVWVSNGTTAGTSLVSDLTPGPESSLSYLRGTIGGRALFSGRTAGEIWITDGSSAGTTLLVDLQSEYLPPYAFTSVAGGALFVAQVNSGSVLWRTDGTPAGTQIVDEFPAGNGASPSLLTDLGGKLMFSPFASPTGQFPFRDLWSSDGTNAGTSLVESFYGIVEVKALGGALYFVAAEGPQTTGLWRTDGTTGRTILIRGDIFPGQLTPAGTRLFFEASDSHGRELWVTDGTPAGTRMVRDIRPGSESSFLKMLGALEGRLFFIANDGVHGDELWRSDGTEAGTVLVKEIRPGPEGCSFQDSAIAFGRIFFGAYDGGPAFLLWSTDGTEAGTYSAGPFDPHRLTASGNLLYFTDGEASKLFRSDGTAAGTRVVHEAEEYSLNVLVGSSNLLYFIGGDLELWCSDGTEAGTRVIRDIRPGEAGSMRSVLPPDLGTVGPLAVFAANDAVHGTELWVSDGSASGTRMLQDIAPGSPSSNPTGFTRSGDLVYFSADDGETGHELWAIPVEELQSAPPRDLEPPSRRVPPTREIPERRSP